MSRAGEVHHPWTDDELLTALAMRDQGRQYADIGKALRRTKSAICGALARIDADLSAAEKAGLLAVAALALVFAVPAQADTLRIMGSTVTLRETTQPGALAEVEFANDPSNGPNDNAGHSLALGALSIGVRFHWNADGDDDRIEVTPPDGVICLPDCGLTVPESGAGSVWLYPLTSVGM